jgi:hypothetical protein
MRCVNNAIQKQVKIRAELGRHIQEHNKSFQLVPRGVLAQGSEHTRPSTLPSALAEIFGASVWEGDLKYLNIFFTPNLFFVCD